MTVYLGKNPVGVGRIVEKKVAKEKYGVTVDNFLGDVDADGNYVAPSEPFEVNLAGVKNVDDKGFYYAFAGSKIKKFIANDVTSFAKNNQFCNCFKYSGLEEFRMDKLEELVEKGFGPLQYVFYYAFDYTSKLKVCTFAKLKKVGCLYAFSNVFSNSGLDVIEDEVFPSLEEIYGTSAFATYKTYKANSIQTFSKVKKITGSASKYDSTFGSFYTQNTIWNFPSATEFTGYIWNVGSSYAGEIHFAAANQAAIESCEGYSYKWGFANATIFFDL